MHLAVPMKAEGVRVGSDWDTRLGDLDRETAQVPELVAIEVVLVLRRPQRDRCESFGHCIGSLCRTSR